MIDQRGRLFGRINLVDALVVAFLAGVVPVAYATYLLFQPARPNIESVERVEISSAERRTAPGNVLSAKMKVRGSGFNPLLRATIGDTPALSFVFESPNSADVLVGEIGPGTYDLVLFDGVQEVARAANAVELHPLNVPSIRVVGSFLWLSPAAADELEEGAILSQGGRIVALGDADQSRTRVALGSSRVDLPVPDRVERGAVLDLTCDPGLPEEPCAIGGRFLTGDPPITVTFPGPLVFEIREVLPSTPARLMRLRVRLQGGREVDLVRTGDREAFLDGRAAVIEEILSPPSGADARTMTVGLVAGLDESREGWRYRGQLVRPGAPITFDAGRYVVEGQVESMAPLTSEGGQ